MFELGPLDAQVGQLHTRRFQLGLGQRHIALRCDAAVEPVLGQLNISFVGLHRGVQQLLRGVQSLNLEVIPGQFRLV